MNCVNESNFGTSEFVYTVRASVSLNSAVYTGEPSDGTIAALVQKEGGNTEGVLRASLLWNDSQRNLNDYDLICAEPDGTLIYYASSEDMDTGGMLDVDVISPQKNVSAVENIAWDDIRKLPEGAYTFYVCNFSDRHGKGGFQAEIAFGNESHLFSYDKTMKEKEIVKVGVCTYTAPLSYLLLLAFP